MSESVHGFIYDKDSDGIVTITMDMDGPVNAMNDQYRKAMAEIPGRLELEEGLTGVVLASGKKTFFAGGDLKALVQVPKGLEESQFRDVEDHIKAPLRRLEKLPVPVVAAINGAAMGGGLEICLAANHRIAWNSPKVIVALPEVTLGLLPGGGGVVRTLHMLGVEKALPLLLEGTSLSPVEAMEAGWVDELVETAEDLVPAAKQWIKSNPQACMQPWDIKGHKLPGGDVWSPATLRQLWAAPAALFKKSRGLLPAPESILAIAGDAVAVDFDTACRIESRRFAHLVTTKEAKNIITANFFQKAKVTKALSASELSELTGGVFTTRVSNAYADEGSRLLKEGVSPALINNLSRFIGMREGPLSSDDFVESLQVDNNSRLPQQDIADRLLVRQVVETLKCLDEGVLRSVAEGNVGSLMGGGAPSWTGGFLQVVNTWEHTNKNGLTAFAARAAELAHAYGERFAAPNIVQEKIRNNETFV
jgi:enoyl-CoA hydratase/carnithine racemase